MKQMRHLVIIVCLLVSKTLGLSQGHLRIINGTAAKPKQFPYQVGLQSYFSNSKDEHSSCGGTIISKRWILTAAHCLQEPKLTLIKVLVVAGIINMNAKELGSVQMWVKRSNTIVHHKYDRNTVAFDIGLIKLPRDLEMSAYIQPAKLPKGKDNKNTYVGRTAISSGWGWTANQKPSDVLQFLTLKIISNKQCEKEWNDYLIGERKLILSSFLCVDSTQGLPCRGDSGGPLILDDNSRTVVGIVSHGFDEICRIKVPDIFTRVSSFIDWIEKHTGRLT
ncbi:chymotrypsin [Drosophila innubila]|uniref:chymotrypsin n=1 Tax=Drosophila innubila TaxID=198719 RepID=UPI00148C5A38|nr:chymotrypsin [Drosophila innubila]